MTPRLPWFVLALGLVLVSCGPQDDVLEPATAACLPGVWQAFYLSDDGSTLVCPRCLSDPPSATEECEQADCAEAWVTIFTAEEEARGHFRWSEALGSMTIPGVCPIAVLPWFVEPPGTVWLDFEVGSDLDYAVECSRSALVIDGHVNVRAPDGFSEAATAMVLSGECSATYTPP